MADLLTTLDTSTVKVIENGTPEHAALLQVGYGMTIEDAKQLIADRERDPHLVPWEEFKKAQAMLQAFEAKPQVVNPKPGWRRQRAI